MNYRLVFIIFGHSKKELFLKFGSFPIFVDENEKYIYGIT